MTATHPSTSASRAALSVPARNQTNRSASSSPVEVVDVEAEPPKVSRPVTPCDENSDDGEDEIDEEDLDSGKRRADSDYPSGDDSGSDDEDVGYQD